MARRTGTGQRLKFGILAVGLVAASTLVFNAPAAQAGVGVSLTPNFGSNSVTVGQTNAPAQVTITNVSTAPEDGGNVTIPSFTLIPSCSNTNAGCAGGTASPGALTISSTATGRAATACAGVTFTVAVTNGATGEVTFTPTPSPIVLPPPPSSCVVDFTFNVNSQPAVDSNPGAAGIQTNQVVTATGTSSVNGDTTTSTGSSTIRVLAAPSIQVVKSAVPNSRPEPGGNFNFTVDITNTGNGPLTIDSIDDNVYGNLAAFPGSTCGPLVGSSLAGGATASCSFTASFTGNAGATQTDTVTVAATDRNGVGVRDDDDAIVTITDVPPTITVTKSPNPPTMSAPGGTFTFLVGVTNNSAEPVTITALTDNIYGNIANQGTCTTAVGTVLAPNGNYSCSFQGAFNGVAGDSQTDTVTATVVDDDRTTATGTASATVRLTGPGITTQASGPVVLGGQISDTATLTGSNAPTGSITFTLFGPDNATCSGLPIFTSTVTVNGNGQYPSDPFTPTTAGTYRWIASYSGDVNNPPASTACNDANEAVQVARVIGRIRTQASPTVVVGGQVTDTATLTGGTSPTGSITFRLFGPNDGTCAGAPAFTSAVAVAGNGNYTSDPFTTTSAGTFRWIADYSGDANNAPITSLCNDNNESVLVTATTPTLVTNASDDVQNGNGINDVATISGGASPTGNIVFTLFGPDNANCSGAPIFTSTVPVSGNGNYTSGTFTTTEAGRYRWIATYGGDSSNNPVGPTACNDPDERVDVSRARPTISTQASGSVATGGTVNDVATLANGVNPKGNILFQIFDPGNTTCEGGTAVFTSVVPVDGNGSYTSENYIVTQPGTYRWIAIYSGDANNRFALGSCNDANESVNVTGTAIPTTTTTTQPVVLPTTTTTTAAPGPTTTTTTAAPGATTTTTTVATGGTTATTKAPPVAFLKVTGANALRLAKIGLILIALGAFAVAVSKRQRRPGGHRG